jgi:hypothetical protein
MGKAAQSTEDENNRCSTAYAGTRVEARRESLLKLQLDQNKMAPTSYRWGAYLGTWKPRWARLNLYKARWDM